MHEEQNDNQRKSDCLHTLNRKPMHEQLNRHKQTGGYSNASYMFSKLLPCFKKEKKLLYFDAYVFCMELNFGN